MDKLKELFARYREIILYLIFGVGTTAVDFAVSLTLVYLFDVNLYLSKVMAWVCAVAFAYVTNRIFVFLRPCVSRYGSKKNCCCP